MSRLDKLRWLADRMEVRADVKARNIPRQLTSDDIEGFLDEPNSPLAEHCMKVNGARWWRLQQDLAWARSQMAELRLDPDTFRDYL